MYNTILEPAHLYRTGIYIRLSKEDKNKQYQREPESESVRNQRSLLLSELKRYGFVLTEEYVDDGWSGTTFDDRPAFNRMIADIESGKINCVMIKDLSRLGRDYIQSGNYLENYFPLKKVRFIAINDGVDTFLDSANNDIVPFKSLFNDMMSKDASKKTRSILKDKKEKGKFIGSSPSYGYMRNPLDKGHLIPNPEIAPIVKRIFTEVSAGVRVSDVIEKLNIEGIKTPSAYKGLKKSSRQINGDIWTISCINKILKNRMYTGDMIQNVQAKLNYKSKKRITLPKSQWIILENTHEPLVSREIFEKIQNTPSRTRITKRGREKRLLEGLVYCKECGNAISVGYRKNRNYWTMNCNKYSRSPRQKLCTPHFFPYNVFEEKIMSKVINTCTKYLSGLDISKLTESVIKDDHIEDISNKEEEVKALKGNIADLQRKIDKLYEDKFNNIISTETYIRLSKDTEDKIKLCHSRIIELESEKEAEPLNKFNVKELEKQIKKLINIKKPTRDLLSALIEKIEVDDEKNVEIIYNFS